MTDLAERQLRKDIVLGLWKPDAWLRLEELKDRYGIGASPLREALSRLTGEGLVLIERNRGFRVAGLSAADLQDIEWMRVAIECAALRVSMERGDAAWRRSVAEAVERLSKVTRHTRTDPASLDYWNDVHDDFHAVLIACCGSPRALEQQQRLADQHRRYRIVLMGENILREEIVQEHEGIGAAVLRGDTDSAARMLAGNMSVTTRFYSDALRQG
ncbi:GntR family transcriptional regulator [Roseomonas mucosa]